MRTFLTVAVLFLLLPAGASSCSCYVPDICERIEGTPVIFLGETVLGGLDPEQDAWRGTANFARLRVVERFRGVPDDVEEIEVSLFFWQGMCSPMPYRQRELTLVFLARDKNGKLRDGMCTASRFADKVPEELELVRSYFSGKMPTTIRGVVTEEGESGYGEAIEGAKVVAERNGSSYSGTTGSSGKYEIAGLPEGEYQVSPEKAGYRYAAQPAAVEVKANGCVTQELGLWARNRISGAVFDRDGFPVRDLDVFLQREGRSEQTWGRQSRTNAKGEFSFQEITPGTYHLAVSPQGVLASSPYVRVYYGGGTERASAVPIEIEPDSRHTGLDLFVGDRYPTRKVTVAIRWPDGSPVETSVVCEDLTAEEPGFPYSESAYTKGGKAATCTVLGDRPYKIRVHSAPNVLPIQALLEPREALLAAGAEDVELEFVLSESDHKRSQEHLRRRLERRRKTREASESSRSF